MKASVRVFQRVPLIKFVGGPHLAPKNLDHSVKAHSQAPDGLKPSSAKSTYFNSNPIEPEEGVFFSRSQLPARFKYSPPKQSEIDNVISGGADLVF
ncbi:hypothetical protein CAAN1_01S08130 [[Candida] anglica]|uniref:Uncharacterized protein n=1 Tax=[Candida] anglica TaxID=148631 RepID=A0ABP0EK09_9ASCO